MNHTQYLRYFGLLGIIVLMQLNCGKKQPALTTPSQKILTGKYVELASATITPAGGNVVIQKGNDQLSGLRIEIPANAFHKNRYFKLSYAPIVSHQFGSAFNPITPLIRIENGGGYANDILKLKIECSVPSGHHPMTFDYNDQSGELEAMPTLEYDSTGITVLVRHFDHATLVNAKRRIDDGTQQDPLYAKSKSDEDHTVPHSSIVIASIVKSDLEKTYESSFTPGKNDWHFPNQGSYIEPNGHSIGQSVTALWYNVIHPEGKSYELFSRHSEEGIRKKRAYILQEDVEEYKLCAVVQRDLKNEVDTFFHSITRASTSSKDYETWMNIAHALIVTNQPQLVFMQNTPTSSPLVMIVYKSTQDALYIADPNFPGDQTRKIVFKSDAFMPYETGENIDHLKSKYSTILFAGQSQCIDWFKIENRWIEYNNGTIGDGLFPAYQLQALDVQKRFTDFDYHTFKTITPLTFRVFGSSIHPKIEAVYDEVGQRVPTKQNTFPLSPGKHLYGFNITDEKNAWVGFKWMDIQCVKDTTDYTRNFKAEITINNNRIQVESARAIIDPQNTLFYLDIKFNDTVFDHIIVRLEYYGGAGNYPFTENASEGKGSYVMFQPITRPQYNIHCSGPGELNITKDDALSIEGNFICKPKCKFNDENYSISGKFVIQK